MTFILPGNYILGSHHSFLGSGGGSNGRDGHLWREKVPWPMEVSRLPCEKALGGVRLSEH